MYYVQSCVKILEQNAINDTQNIYSYITDVQSSKGL